MQHAQQKQQEMINVQEDRMMQMYQEDRKAIEHYRQQGAGNFQMSSKKSLARNFRDYEIYKAVIPQVNAYRQYQAAGRGGQKVRR